MTENDIALWVGIVSGGMAILAALFALLWKIFRKVDQMDDTAQTAALAADVAQKASGVAEAAVQAHALVDKRLVGIELELTANGGGSLKDDVKAIRDGLPAMLEGNNRVRDASFLDAASPWMRRVEALEGGHRTILGRLDDLSVQIGAATGEILTSNEDKTNQILEANQNGNP